ncbi:uncharacterized protein LOC107263010 isoform X2 [Cephus cinctus]|uniref:Uncharacterized protein LOC107263010 isoform X2 n=1 Tax=Cephus cinctus TaxID=211228 RepID=A0AAJ7R8J8_CEPCN|nr:uncharacterized protein LOC107263010 isoform X2 [Cephus cinctus]XP_024936294.1 uncharacterized protein LOC107263010 isoform X2 [Cephus cinctus]
MLEWIGICCCSSFVSCICSLITSTFCLSPRGVRLRGSMSRTNKNKKLEQSQHGVCVTRRKGSSDPKRNRGVTSMGFCENSENSCTCLPQGLNIFSENFSCPSNNQRYLGSHNMLRQCPLIKAPCTCTVPSGPISRFSPLQDPSCYSIPNESEFRKCIDEYNAVFKQYNDLIGSRETTRIDSKKLDNPIGPSKGSTSCGVTCSATTEVTEDGRTSVTRASSKKMNSKNTDRKSRSRRSCGKSSSDGKIRKTDKKRISQRDMKHRHNEGSENVKVQECLRKSTYDNKTPCYYIDNHSDPLRKSPSVRSSWLQKTVKKICERSKKDDCERCLCDLVVNDVLGDSMVRQCRMIDRGATGKDLVHGKRY